MKILKKPPSLQRVTSTKIARASASCATGLTPPTRYRRVKFECDNEHEAPQALDDIVIERSDGLVDLQQIKFTPDADKHPLCWDWMLENTGKTDRSRSMLRKWFDAYNKLEPARTGDISLITNRRPDAAIEACLAGDKIAPSRIQEPQRTRVVAELGSLEACTLFFSQLRIRHSDKGYVALENDIESRLRQHGTPEGIANLNYVALLGRRRRTSLRQKDGLRCLTSSLSCEPCHQRRCPRILLSLKDMKYLMQHFMMNFQTM
ncbi:hypothetical protein [Pantoea agglomerans]|uniref:hypothetical protein n=1 Tax=Enterobacter agglomerans TaxID=549 RepID=UPI0032084842